MKKKSWLKKLKVGDLKDSVVGDANADERASGRAGQRTSGPADERAGGPDVQKPAPSEAEGSSGPDEKIRIVVAPRSPNDNRRKEKAADETTGGKAESLELRAQGRMSGPQSSALSPKLIEQKSKKFPIKRRWFFFKKKIASSPAEQPNNRIIEQPKKDIVNESLATIYEGRPSKEWMNTFERGRRKTWLVVLGALAAFFAIALAATWAGFLWFGGHGFSGQGLAIGIEGPDQISIGQEVTYYVNWLNTSKEPLASVEFHVSFPNDFVLTDVSPKPTSSPLSDNAKLGVPQTLSFRLGAQPVEARGTMKFVGRFTGALGTKSAIQVISTYRPASFNSDFESLKTKEIAYTGSILSGHLEVPQKVVPGDVVAFTYSVENTGADRMPGIAARFTFPDGFIPASGTSIGIDGLTPTFEIGALEPGASSTVAIRGSFSLDVHGDQPIRADAGIFTSDGTFAPAQTSEATVSVLAGDLKVDLIVNGSQADRSVNPGDIQRISIGYLNTSDEVLKDVVLTLRLSGMHPSSSADVTFADWTALAFDGATGSRKGNALSFTKANVKDFGELAPNAQGMIDISVPILATIVPENDVPVSAYVEAKIGAVGDTKVNRTVKTTPIALRIRSDVKIDAAAKYSSDEGIKLGSGPLPPVVGSSTTYRIEWHVVKSLHELSRLTVSATLPNGINFGSVKEVGAGDVGYDPDKKLVTWSVNRMPVEVGELIASFDVSLSPSEADVGRFASLLGETRLEVTDAVINESVLRTSPPLSTELPDDQLAKKKGVVAH